MNERHTFFWKPHKELELKTEKAITTVADMLKQCLGRRADAVILTGSLARGEGVWKQNERGDIDILSDLDLLVIVHGRKQREPSVHEKVGELEKQLNLTIDIKFVPATRARLLPKDTHTFDLSRTGKVLNGKNFIAELPLVNQRDLGMSSVEAIFFNRAFLNIEKIAPADFARRDDPARAALSYEAARTLFTCTDIIAIYQHRYSSFVRQRIETTKQCRLEFLDWDMFLKDLGRATDFVFGDQRTCYLASAHDDWLRARTYLVTLFTALMNECYHSSDLFRYPSLAHRAIRSPREQLRLLYKKLLATYTIYSTRHTVRLFVKNNPLFLCRMACLMLYLAIGSEEEGNYIQKACNYYAAVDPLERPESTPSAWTAVRNQLVTLHDAGVF
jgi:predicted nucleotidyltransferase